MNISIIGLARSGYSAAKLALKLGYKVKVSDACVGAHLSEKAKSVLLNHARELEEMGAWVELEKHSRDCLENADVVVVSPGVPDDSDPIIWAKKQNIKIISEIEFAVRHTNAKVIGITGTNGKTTTTSLIGHMLDCAEIPSVVAGNIGQALSGVIEKVTDKHLLVLELSSFQLQSLESIKPFISVWLNLTPEHLDRHLNINEYLAAKAKIFKNMNHEDWAVVWNNDRDFVLPYLKNCGTKCVWIDESASWSSSKEEQYGAICFEEELKTDFNGIQQSYGNKSELQLKGNHNIVNVLVACAVGRILQIPDHVIKKAIASFKPLEHRLEFVGEKNGIVYINDSKATNIDAVIKALEAFDKPVSLIAGGYDKGSDFSALIPFIKEKVCRLTLVGNASAILSRELAGTTEIVFDKKMKTAVNKASENLKPGSVVLLAPGCASFDMYDNFEERGVDFKNCVSNIIKI